MQFAVRSAYRSLQCAPDPYVLSFQRNAKIVSDLTDGQGLVDSEVFQLIFT
jgi:hypothetical protein